MVIDFSIYNGFEADEIAQLLGKTFTRRDPLAVAAGLTEPEFVEFVQVLCPKAAYEGLTMVARSAETGEIVGALVTEDAASAPAEGLDRISPKFDPIFDILGQLEANYGFGQTTSPGEHLHLFLLGVSPDFMGRGIAQQLVVQCLEHGANKGYQVAVAEATGLVSQHIFRKQGFTERGRGSYQDHRFNGLPIFTSIAEHQGPMLMEKRLAA